MTAPAAAYPGVPPEAFAAISLALAAGRFGAGQLVAGEAGGVVALQNLPAFSVLLFSDVTRFTCRTLQADTPAAETGAWRSAEAVPAGGLASDDARWALLCPLLASVRHVETSPPNVVVAALPDGACEGGASALVTLRPVAPGEELLRDGVAGRPRTAARAATLLELFPASRWRDPSERDAVEAALLRTPPPPPPAGRADARGGASPALAPPPPPPPPLVVSPSEPCRVFTDYSLLAKELLSCPGFEVTASPQDISLLWLLQNVSNFDGLPPGLLVNQFPFEGCLVRKDLLPATAKLAAATENALVAEDACSAFPPWCPETYDLATEAHVWARAASAAPPETAWIVKRAAGLRSQDVAITACASAVARFAAAPGPVDRIAQRYVSRCATLLNGRKFDVRFYVAVRAFAPLEAAVDARCYGRVAPSPLSGAPLTASDAHLTVSWYDASAAPSALLNSEQLGEAVAAEGFDWEAALSATRSALRQLFAAAGAGFIGSHPNSRALYGVDVLYELPARDDGTDDGTSSSTQLLPQILEVNFGGDLKTLLERVPGGAPGFVNDALMWLVGGEGASKLVPL